MDPQQAQIYRSHYHMFAPIERKAPAGLDGSNYRARHSAIVATYYPRIASSKLELAVARLPRCCSADVSDMQLGFGGKQQQH